MVNLLHTKLKKTNMKLKNYILSLLCLLSLSCFSQDKELSWKELSENYEFPEWYTEARFGIWVHWGAQTAPLQGGGWYARHMYMEDVGKEKWGKDAYSYHKNKFGDPSEIGFKDVINEWKAEKLDTDALVAYFKSVGAKYFVALANHHDHFDNFDSTHHPWNSVNMGPKRDIIGEFEKSTKKYEIPFGVSSHDDRFLDWWLPAFGADTSGPHKGIPYDGHMTIEDGKGKWWEGLNPADLYGLPPAERTPEYIEKIKQNWMLRHKELVTKYDIDMIWFDGYNFPYDEYGKEVCETFFNKKRQSSGKINAVVAGKFHNEPSTVKDIERGGASEILLYPWQGITTLRTWFYKEDIHAMDYRHSAKTVIETLADYNSKNGNLLLNVELLGDGTIPTTQKIILDEIGAWMHLNSEAIYASKPWKIYGDNLNSYLKVLEESGIGEADLEALKRQNNQEHFNERTLKSPDYGNNEVRFTTNGDVLYMFVLNPSEGKIEIPSLGLNSKEKPGEISSIELIGSDAQIEFKQDNTKLLITVPVKRPNKLTTVFRIKGVL